MRQEEVEAKEKTDYETVCFHSFKYIADHGNVRFFLLSKFFTLLRVILSVLVAGSSWIASQLSQVYSHTIFYLNTILIKNKNPSMKRTV